MPFEGYGGKLGCEFSELFSTLPLLKSLTPFGTLNKNPSLQSRPLIATREEAYELRLMKQAMSSLKLALYLMNLFVFFFIFPSCFQSSCLKAKLRKSNKSIWLHW